MFPVNQLTTLILFFASLLTFSVAGSKRGVFEKEIGPGKAGALATAGLGLVAVQAPLKGLQGAAYSTGDAANALSKGKIVNAMGHTVMAPVKLVSGAVVGAGALAISPFPAMVGGGIAAYNGLTGSNKGKNTLKFDKQLLRETLEDPKAARKAKIFFNKKDMERLYAPTEVGSSQQSERSYSGSSLSSQTSYRSSRPPGSVSSSATQLPRSYSTSSRHSEGHRRSGSQSGSIIPQRPSSSVTNHGVDRTAVGSSASRPRSTTSSVRSGESRSRSGAKSIGRSASARHM